MDYDIKAINMVTSGAVKEEEELLKYKKTPLRTRRRLRTTGIQSPKCMYDQTNIA